MCTYILRRALSWVLALLLVFSMLPVPAFAQSTENEMLFTSEPQTDVEMGFSEDSEAMSGDGSEEKLPEETISETESITEPEASASERVRNAQKLIDNIVATYVGSLTVEDDISAFVDNMISNTFESAFMDIINLGDTEEFQFLTEAEKNLLASQNPTFSHFALAVEDRYDRDYSFSLLASPITIQTYCYITYSGTGASDTTGTDNTKIVVGSGINSDTSTVTIKNTAAASSYTFLYLDYSCSSYNSCTVNGTSSASGSLTLAPQDTVTIVFSSKGWFSQATLSLTGIKTEVKTPSVSVTVSYDSGGVTSSDGNTIAASGTTIQVDSASGTTLTATANNFVAWVNTTDNSIISTSPSLKINPTETISLRAVSTSNACFKVSSYLYESLTSAANYASSASDKVIVLMNNGTLPALKDEDGNDIENDYTIPAGVTLLIPFDDANTLYTTEPEIQRLDSTSTTNEKVYRTLTMATGANITVNGAISVSAKQIGAHSPYYNSGAPYGDYGHIAMQGTSSITLESGAALYAWGFITGSGSVVAKNGATVYEGFVFQDWRGGDATSTMEDVLPLCQYYVQNIQVPLTLYYGATEKVRMTVHITVGMQSCTLNFIAPSDGIFNLTSGYVTKRYDNSTDRLIMEAYGDMTVSPTTITMGSEILGGATINTKDFAFPITNNLTMVINSGTMTVNQDIALLPGSEVYIRANGNIVLGTGINVYVYDSDQWGGYCGTYGAKFIPLTYVPGRTYNRTNADLKDVIVQVDGTFDASAGYLYTTSGGANICSTGTGTVITTAGTAKVTYQNSRNADTNTEIPITPAKLKNADGTYTETTGASNTTYEYYNGKWCCHATWTDANCTTAKTCSGCGKTEGTPLGHSASTDWTSDATSHWHTCENGCDEKLDKADHTDGDPVLENPDTNAGTCESVVYCTSCEAELSRDTISLVQLAAINASADAEVILMLKFVIPDAVLNDAKATVIVYFREESYSYAVSDLEKDENGRYVVSQNIASGEMTCPVTVQFDTSSGSAGIYDYASQKCDTSVSRTVRDYAERVLNSSAASEGQKEIVTALVTYGGYSQIVFGVNTDDLAYDVLGSTPSLNVESITDAVSRSGSIGITQTTQEAHLDSAIWLRVYFELDDGKSIDDYSFKLTYPINGVTATMTVIPSYDSANSRYYVDIKDIPAAYLDNPYTFTITSSEGTYTVTTSVVAYLASLLSSSEATAAQKNAAKAMYLYSQAASEFFNK